MGTVAVLGLNSVIIIFVGGSVGFSIMGTTSES